MGACRISLVTVICGTQLSLPRLLLASFLQDINIVDMQVFPMGVRGALGTLDSEASEAYEKRLSSSFPLMFSLLPQIIISTKYAFPETSSPLPKDVRSRHALPGNTERWVRA